MAKLYPNLDPETRCFALVGAFLGNWSLLESSINTAIGNGLKLDVMQMFIVTRNIQIAAKLNILKACTSVVLFSDVEKKEFQKLLQQIADYAPKRHMMAHDVFVASEKSDGVEFYHFTARDKVGFVETDWTSEDFDSAIKKLDEFYKEIKKLSEKLKSSHSLRAIAEALMKNPAPTDGTISLSSLGHLFHQPLDAPHSHPAEPMQPKGPRKLPKPQE